MGQTVRAERFPVARYVDLGSDGYQVDLISHPSPA